MWDVGFVAGWNLLSRDTELQFSEYIYVDSCIPLFLSLSSPGAFIFMTRRLSSIFDAFNIPWQYHTEQYFAGELVLSNAPGDKLSQIISVRPSKLSVPILQLAIDLFIHLQTGENCSSRSVLAVRLWVSCVELCLISNGSPNGSVV